LDSNASSDVKVVKRVAQPGMVSKPLSGLKEKKEAMISSEI